MSTPCANCNGTGSVDAPRKEGVRYTEHMECPVCHGVKIQPETNETSRTDTATPAEKGNVESSPGQVPADDAVPKADGADSSTDSSQPSESGATE